MKTYLELTKKELKRVDHLIFVSLKYTRTVDVIRNILKRLIDAMDAMLASMLKYQDIEEIHDIPIQRVKQLENLVTDSKLKEILTYYIRLRKIYKEKYVAHDEYRRPVGMTVKVDGEIIDITIDSIEVMYHEVQDYYNYLIFLDDPTINDDVI